MGTNFDDALPLPGSGFRYRSPWMRRYTYEVDVVLIISGDRPIAAAAFAGFLTALVELGAALPSPVELDVVELREGSKVVRFKPRNFADLISAATLVTAVYTAIHQTPEAPVCQHAAEIIAGAPDREISLECPGGARIKIMAPQHADQPRTITADVGSIKLMGIIPPHEDQVADRIMLTLPDSTQGVLWLEGVSPTFEHRVFVRVSGHFRYENGRIVAFRADILELIE